jgi:hypothetical protein
VFAVRVSGFYGEIVLRKLSLRGAVDLLVRGATPYDVAKLLGDTVATVEKHYAPFVKELRDRARNILESGEGLEKTDCTTLTQSRAKRAAIQ